MWRVEEFVRVWSLLQDPLMMQAPSGPLDGTLLKGILWNCNTYEKKMDIDTHIYTCVYREVDVSEYIQMCIYIYIDMQKQMIK